MEMKGNVGEKCIGMIVMHLGCGVLAGGGRIAGIGLFMLLWQFPDTLPTPFPMPHAHTQKQLLSQLQGEKKRLEREIEGESLPSNASMSSLVNCIS
jgi:hypothetical protein